MQKTYTDIPHSRPLTPLLDTVNTPADLRKLNADELVQLTDELRLFMLFCVGKTGGHFGAGLGVTELTVALHYVFNTPNDRLVWDVGHQTYPHKILTGRREKMLSMRQKDGLSGFPKRSESEYDTFGVGHSSTSISAALGMAMASAELDESRKTVAIMGDGAMTAGMAFEAINHASHVDKDLLVILNDNQMSISKNVGGLSTYFSKLWASRFYNQLRERGKKALSSLPHAKNFVRRTEEYMKSMVSPATIFEELGFYYIGPIDGHDLPLLVQTLTNLKAIKGPVMLHIITHKGKGFAPAENDPVGYHALNKIEPKQASLAVADEPPKPAKPKYQKVFGDWLCDMAAKDQRLIGITPAMCDGSGMNEFAERFPERYEDVAIAEQHAVTLAAGMACEGLKPVVAIYSTFLQRAYDQLIHDVAIQNLDVLFALDRAGLVGEDGATHAGAYDISYLRCIPNMLLMAPSDENETRQLLYTGYMHTGPAAVRYPRGTGPGATIQKTMSAVPIGKGVVVREGGGAAILNFGTLLDSAITVADQLNSTVADMRFIKPIDKELIRSLAETHDLLVTLEENSIAGGAGSGVIEFLAAEGIVMPVLQLGLPDKLIDHGTHAEQLVSIDLDTASIQSAIAKRLKLIMLPAKAAQ
ncbi:MAG: 1-deoxy-D-xylulose-5-phosphate synthase [Porticoccaceae bacterium UBA1117]|jgi:1-deoxy-D-xylulose-5-phosphate synthase|nr:1-deoxy-D-xylulose-5-phosphate synthase [Porticoccaceae bacterium]CAI8331741.1 MAG: 1-deoxy-D-xylulose-5-phosphate synthase [Porticoccaceae bacterium UBA1117]